jgi:hypothetical protein
MKINNGYSFKKNGWTYISVKGKPKERGFAYGYYCAAEFKEVQKMLQYYIFESYGYPWSYFIEKINDDFKKMTKDQYFELYQEMEGIAEGCTAGGCKTTIDEIIAWNFYCSLPYWYSFTSDTHVGKEGGGANKGLEQRFIPLQRKKHANDKCSAFMAVGDWTKDGKIVVGHNSFCDYIDGQYSNVILDMNPENGYRFMMQTSPCWIWSGTDFFITTSGIIGTETTTGGFQPYEKNIPVGYRIRIAMQYATTIDGYISLLLNGNSGDYANSWLIADIKTNEIARIELGLKYHSVDRTKSGYLIGFNAPYDPRVRNIEVNNSGFYDIRRHQGARRVRLTQLMKKYKGKLNLELGKKILADHYDVYLKKDNNPCSRTICSHYDLDAREYMSQADRPVPYAPHGAVDGMVCDTTLAENMSFVGKFGSSCDIPFYKDKYCRENIQFSNICYFLKDRPSQPWTKFQVHNFDKQGFDKDLNFTKQDRKDHIAEVLKVKGESPVEIKLNSNVNYYTMDGNTNIERKYFIDDNIHYIPTNSLLTRFSIKDNNNFFNQQTNALKKEGKIIKTRKNKAFNKTRKNKIKQIKTKKQIRKNK